MPVYKLTYFDIRGRAELSRCVFAAAGQKFEDVRVTNWENDKAKTKYGQLPELSVDGKVLAQSNSIARYLSREFGLAGKDSWEQGQVDQYVEMANDLFEQLVKVVFEKDETRKKELEQKLGEETLPKFMGFFEKDLRNNGDFLVGGSLTLADLAVQNSFDNFLQKDPAALDKFPKLKAHRAKVHGSPKLCDYIKTRKKADI